MLLPVARFPPRGRVAIEAASTPCAQIAQGIAGRSPFSANDVIVNLVESAREKWSFGDGVAQYVAA